MSGVSVGFLNNSSVILGWINSQVITKNVREPCRNGLLADIHTARVYDSICTDRNRPQYFCIEKRSSFAFEGNIEGTSRISTDRISQQCADSIFNGTMAGSWPLWITKNRFGRPPYRANGGGHIFREGMTGKSPPDCEITKQVCEEVPRGTNGIKHGSGKPGPQSSSNFAHEGESYHGRVIKISRDAV